MGVGNVALVRIAQSNVRKRLQSKNVKFRESIVPRTGDTQIFLYDPDGVFQENVARCSKAQFIAGPHRPKENELVHATEVFLKPLERLAIYGADPIPKLALSTSVSLPAGTWLPPTIRSAVVTKVVASFAPARHTSP